MSATKVAISLDDAVLRQLDKLVKTRPFRSRSQTVQEAVSEKINRLDRTALAKECAKLDAKSEQAMADAGIAADPTRFSARRFGRKSISTEEQLLKLG